jgi:hypothetical protein
VWPCLSIPPDADTENGKRDIHWRSSKFGQDAILSDKSQVKEVQRAAVGGSESRRSGDVGARGRRAAARTERPKHEIMGPAGANQQNLA